MKKLFLSSITLIGLIQTGQSNNYYFSDQTGDDSRSSVQAQNSLTPWKTIAKLNSYFLNLQPGDSILF
ncbi:MAG: hypothetical protein H0W84_05780, partial [Bacteroidetes bacterium]|nr:hypothetical protein [Bacteroidota bacterium]